MLGNDVGPKRWRKHASYHRVPTAVSEGQSFQPFQDTQFIPLGCCCPVIKPQGQGCPSGAAFSLSLIGQWLFCGYADKAGRQGNHRSNPQCASPAELQSTAQQEHVQNYSFLSFLAPFSSFFIIIFSQQSPRQLCSLGEVSHL